jgi:hypothetical protein
MGEPEEDKTSYSISPADLGVSTSTPTYSIKEQRKIIKDWAKNNVVGKIIYVPSVNKYVEITPGGIKEAINQPHKKAYYKNESIKHIEKILVKSTFVRTDPSKHGNPDLVFHYLEFKLDGDSSFVVLKETKHDRRVWFYAIVDNLKK